MLSIPERDRTDAEWDELNELEIQTAPGNRAGNPQQPFGYNPGAKQGFHQKNRPKSKGKPGGPGGGTGGPHGGRPQQGKPHNANKPRPA